jgi:crotonobetainyl-CoA:carnitine CoA-transferase CaiB-like acyl-CoA transferase
LWRTDSDEYLYLHVGIPAHLRKFLAVLGKEGFAAESAAIMKLLHRTSRHDPVSLHSTAEASGITEVMRRLFLERSAGAWEDLLTGAGLCCNRIRTFDEWKNHPQVTTTGQIINCVLRDGTSISVPGPLYCLRDNQTPAPAPDCHTELFAEQCSTMWDDHPASVNAARKTSADTGEYLPLKGIRVIDISRVIAGPFAARLLAESGAEVLQVVLRKSHLSWEEPFGIIFNAGKQSVTVNYAHPEAKALFRKLLHTFKPDIIISNYLDDAAKKMECDYASCKALLGDVLYLDIHPYGPAGPWYGRPGYEWNIQAASGMINTFSRGLAEPQALVASFNDLSAGLAGSCALLLLLVKANGRRCSGHVAASLSTSSILAQIHYLNDRVAQEHTRHCNRFFRAADRYFLLSADRNGLERLGRHPLFSGAVQRNGQLDERSLARIFRKRTAAGWIDQLCSDFPDASLIIAPGCSLVSLLNKELRRLTDGMFSYVVHEGFGKLLAAAPPVFARYSRKKSLSPAPYWGSGTVSYLESLGTDPAPHRIIIPDARKMRPGFIRSARRTIFAISQLLWIIVIFRRRRSLRQRVR